MYNSEKYRSLDIYLKELSSSKYDPLDPYEEIELIQEYRAGSKKAFDKLVTSNLKFVISVAKKSKSNLNLEDKIGFGTMGLMRAIEKFDETKGFKLISYAVHWINRSINQANINYSRMVRIPSNVIINFGKINNFKEIYQQENDGANPSDEVLEREFKNKDSFLKSTKKVKRELSLDSSFDKESDYGLYNVLIDETFNAPDYDVLNKDLKKEIYHIMDKRLDDREKFIVTRFMGLEGDFPLTLNNLSERLGIGKERVRQIKDKAIRKLMRSQDLNYLRSYL